MDTVDYSLYLVTGRDLLPPDKVCLSSSVQILELDCTVTGLL